MYSAAIVALCVASTARADSILYESATNGGGLANGGNEVDHMQFLGSEFTLNSTATISNIIGEVHSFEGPNTFFMTLLELSGPGLPNNLTGDPFGGTNQLYTTTFSAAADFSSDEMSFPVSLKVPAGTYAIVFGSGLFGSPATAVGAMPGTLNGGNIVQPGANVIIWYDHTDPQTFAGANWLNSINTGERFVVEGTAIPEPSSAIMLSLVLVVLAVRRLTKRTGHPLTWGAFDSDDHGQVLSGDRWRRIRLTCGCPWRIDILTDFGGNRAGELRRAMVAECTR
jgi:hypothetical protein